MSNTHTDKEKPIVENIYNFFLAQRILQMQYSQLPPGIVAILMTHSNLAANHLDIRLDLHTKVCNAEMFFCLEILTEVVVNYLLLTHVTPLPFFPTLFSLDRRC